MFSKVSTIIAFFQKSKNFDIAKLSQPPKNTLDSTVHKIMNSHPNFTTKHSNESSTDVLLEKI